MSQPLFKYCSDITVQTNRTMFSLFIRYFSQWLSLSAIPSTIFKAIFVIFMISMYLLLQVYFRFSPNQS